MHFRDRNGRRRAPLVLVALAAIGMAAGCQEDGREAGSDPLFAPGGGGPKPKLQDVTVQVGPENSADVAVNGGWFVAAYNLASGLEGTPAFVDCDAASPCSTVLTVPTGTYAFIAFPGRRADFPGYVPLPPDAASWECIVTGCADPTSAAVVTQLVGGEIGSAPLARWTFDDGFVVEISNKPPDPVVLVPPPAVLQEIEYDDLEQFNGDEGNFGDTQPRSTSVVFPLCWTATPYSSWGYSIPADGNGALPAVPLTGAVANPAQLPMPDYSGYPNPGAETCGAYTSLTGLPFYQFVYELDFSGTPLANGETLLSTLGTDATPTPGTITQYTRPLLCDAQTGKYSDEAEGDGDKIDFLSPFVNGFQADVDPDLVLHPIPDAVAGWFSQQVLLDGTTAVLTIKNRSADGGAYSLSAKYTCSATGCALDGVNSNAPDVSGFEINFRPAEGATPGDGRIETSWSWVGLPYPVDGVNGNVVTIEVKAPGDQAPEASRDDATSSDFAIPFSDTCKDTNDGRWALG